MQSSKNLCQEANRKEWEEHHENIDEQNWYKHNIQLNDPS